MALPKPEIQVSGTRSVTINLYFFIRKIIAQNGIRGLWRGCWPNVQRAALVNLGKKILPIDFTSFMYIPIYLHKIMYILHYGDLIFTIQNIIGDLSTYDSVKANILRNTNLKDNSLTHMLSSGCAG